MIMLTPKQTIQHVYFSNYTFAQLHSLMLLMLECCDDPQKHHGAIYDKYADKRYKRASQFVQSELNKGFQAMDITSNPPAVCQPIREDKCIYAY